MEPKGKKKKWEILFIYIILLTRAFPPKNKLSLMFFKILSKFIQVRSFYEHSCAILSSLKIMIIFNKVSWCIIENDHNFEKTEDRATVFIKWMDFRSKIITKHKTEYVHNSPVKTEVQRAKLSGLKF